MPDVDKDSPVRDIVQAAIAEIRPTTAEASLSSCLFLVRRRLMASVLQPYSEMPSEWKESAQASLPPLSMPAEGLLTWSFSFSHIVSAIFLAVFAARALWEGVQMAVPFAGLVSLFAIAFLAAGLLFLAQRCRLWVHGEYKPGFLGASGASEAAEKTEKKTNSALSAVKSLGKPSSEKLFFYWIAWTYRRALMVVLYLFRRQNLRRMGIFLYFAVAVLALIRDFWAGRDLLQQSLTSIRLLLTEGLCWPLFSSFYGFWLWFGLCLFLVCTPRRLDQEALSLRMESVANQWYTGAERQLRFFREQYENAQPMDMRRMRKLGQDLYSFVRELKPAQQAWLLERLKEVGMHAPVREGALLWQDEMRAEYDVLGYIEEGDRCFVDTPPLYEDGKLLRRGVMRKVRS